MVFRGYLRLRDPGGLALCLADADHRKVYFSTEALHILFGDGLRGMHFCAVWHSPWDFHGHRVSATLGEAAIRTQSIVIGLVGRMASRHRKNRHEKTISGFSGYRARHFRAD